MNPRFEVVLVHPEIAGNSGNIGRSCMALGCRLHLVHPLGYQITDANLKRAGMDYWPNLDLKQHESLKAWMDGLEEGRPIVIFTTQADKDFDPKEVPDGAFLVFGSESVGLPQEVQTRWAGQARKIPMDPRARSLNLSACVAMVLGSLILK